MTSCGPAWTYSVWQSSWTLPCRRHAVWIDCQLSIPGIIDVFSTNLAQEILVLSAAAPCSHHRHVAELGNLSYIHAYERVRRQWNRHIVLQYQVTVCWKENNIAHIYHDIFTNSFCISTFEIGPNGNGSTRYWPPGSQHTLTFYVDYNSLHWEYFVENTYNQVYAWCCNYARKMKHKKVYQ